MILSYIGLPVLSRKKTIKQAPENYKHSSTWVNVSSKRCEEVDGYCAGNSYVQCES